MTVHRGRKNLPILLGLIAKNVLAKIFFAMLWGALPS
jgi:hypothetical protein